MYESEKNKQSELDEKTYRINLDYKNLQTEIDSIESDLLKNNNSIISLETKLLHEDDETLSKELKNLKKKNDKLTKKN